MMSDRRVVLAEYFATDDATLLFVVRADFEEPEVVEIPMSLDDIRAFVTAHFGQDATTVRALDLDSWQATFGRFVEPIARWAEPEDVVWFVPHDALHRLPLHALRIDGAYLIERNPVCYSPSASVMKYCQARRRPRSNAGLRSTRGLVLGDSRGNLPYARIEAVAVADLLDTAAHLGHEATKALVTSVIEERRDEVDILHLACHGRFDAVQALRSRIELAPNGDGGPDLTAEEIFGLTMSADLVTLSACESGVNERRPGDELIGLTRALLYAGTPSVLVSLWQVSDLSTTLCMERFYRHFKQGGSKVDALREAQRELMRMTYAEARGEIEARRHLFEALPAAEAARAKRHLGVALLGLESGKPAGVDRATWQPFQHPYHWAPFVLVGDWL
jgi:CHAT domain-containing protein